LGKLSYLYRPTLLRSDPVQKHGTPCTQHGSEPEDREPAALREVVNLPPVSALAEDEFRDLVGATKQVVGEWR
jgi:hypothetical protein